MAPAATLRQLIESSSTPAHTTKESAVEWMVALVKQAGLRSYAYQASEHEATIADSSSLIHRWPSDMARGSEHVDVFSTDSVMIMTDVDYHVNMNSLLVGQPLLIYTLNITEPTFHRTKMNYTFVDNCIVMRYGDKEPFKHELWDYSVDFITTTHPSNCTDINEKLKLEMEQTPTIMARLRKAADLRNYFKHSDTHFTYKVTRRTVGGYYQFVYFEPMKVTRGELLIISAIVSMITMIMCLLGIACASLNNLERPPPLERRKITHVGKTHKWTLMRHMDLQAKEPDELRFCVEGTSVYYTVNWNHYRELTTISETRPLNIIDYKKYVDIEEVDERSRVMSLFMELVRDLNVTVREHKNPRPKVVNYAYTDDYEQKFAGGITPLMNPLVETGCSPVACKENEIAAYKTRILDLADPTGIPEPSNFVMQCTREFINATMQAAFDGQFYLTPWSDGEVLEYQDTPAKRATVGVSAMAKRDPNQPVSGFVKCEASATAMLDDGTWDAKDPRMITHVDNYAKAFFMRFIYPFKKHVSANTNFFGFGMRPEELEERLMRIMRESNDGIVFEGDMSRMDGRKSRVGRATFGTLLVNSFSPTHRDAAQEAYIATVNTTVRTRHGHVYKGLMSLASGSPDTTDNNSWDMAFMCYLSKRLEGASPSTAYTWLNTCVLVSGDDSLAVNISPEHFKDACKMCGHKSKVLLRKPMEPFSFLGRYYAPWRESVSQINSCQDPGRIFTKFTSCASKFNTVKEKHARLHEKCCAVLTTDRNTPVISEVARSVLGILENEYGWPFKEVYLELNYNLSAGVYTNYEAEWMWDLLEKQLPTLDIHNTQAKFKFARTIKFLDRYDCLAPPVEYIAPPGVTFLDENGPLDCTKGVHEKIELPAEKITAAEGLKYKAAVRATIKELSTTLPVTEPPTPKSKKRRKRKTAGEASGSKTKVEETENATT